MLCYGQKYAAKQLSIHLCHVMAKSTLSSTLFVCEEGGCRPEADVGADLKAAIATAVQPGDWHRPNTEDEADSKDFTQSAHATGAV